MAIELGTVLDTTPAAEADAGEVVEEVVEADGGEAAVEGEEPEAAAAEGEETDAGETETGDEEVAQSETDSRKVDANVRKAIAEIKKTDPATAKALQANYFENRAYKTEFPTVQDARNAKLALENLGGEEGIEALNSEVQDYRNEIEQFAHGDAALLKQLHEANPESFVTMTTNALDMLQQMDSKAFTQAIIPTLASVMDSWGFNNAVVKLANYIKEGKGQEAYDLVREVAQELGNLKTAAEQRKATPKADPKAEALTEREKNLQQREEKAYQENMGRVFGPANEQVVSKLIAPVVKQMKLRGDGLRDFKNGFYQKVFAAIKADKVFQKQAQSIIAKGDAEKAGRFLASKFAELAPGIFTKYRNSLYPNLVKSSTKGAPADKGTGPKAVPGKVYTREQVDLRATPSEFVIIGQAYLKGTKTLVKYAQ